MGTLFTKKQLTHIKRYDIFNMKKEIKMNLFSNAERPILDCLTRIYRYNGKWDLQAHGRGGRCCASLYGDV